MNYRGYAYTDVDDDHFPDCYLGSSEYYSIEFREWLSEENDNFVKAEWELPDGVTGSEDFTSDVEAYIKLTPQKRGTHKIQCRLFFEEIDGNNITRSQQKQIVMMLKVH